MNDLIARLEKATGPSRELADDVLLACGWTIDEYGPGPDRARIWQDPDPKGEDYLDGDHPDPTASIDAAMMLVPAEWHWRLDQGRNAGAALYRDGFPQHFSVADTPALALCVVALKARTALSSGQGTE